MKKFGLFIVFLSIALIVGCGDGSTSEEIPAVAEQEIRLTDAIPENPVNQPVAEGVFRRIWSDPPTLDPALVSDTTSMGIVAEVFSGLVTLNTDLRLEPDLAESWEISSDGTVYTFKISENAKFHNGKQVTATDFKWSLERAANPQTVSPVAETYLNDIVGVMDVIEGRASEITGIKVIDDRTLQITIDAPKAYFLAKLTYPTAFVVDRENVESGGQTWTDEINGTGPFKLKEYKIGERIVLERFDNLDENAGGVDLIVMNLAGGQSMAMYENNEIDITGVGLFDLERVLDPNEPLNRELVIAPPDFSISYIGFNTQMAPFDDVKFRQALNHAIDKKLIAEEVLSNLVTPAYGILPPGFPGYNEQLEGLRYDSELAKQLLAESKYSDGATRPRIVVTVPGRGGSVGLDMEVILEMWRQVLGVEVEIQQVEWATYLEDLNQNKFQAFAGLGWEADYPDPQDFLDILFHSDSKLNHGKYSNGQVDLILENARINPDPVDRVELYQDAEQLIVTDAAWVPLWFEGERHVLIKPYVKGYRLTPMTVPKLSQVKIEK
ncbi:MAG: peptide ABC transporter substrate-binding protein [SAR202 cluster bacterium]|nr:peptide ABC transporter substrate-binding protein [SAR202 cluster bacterium]|tara:strand:+ start:1347 stop:3002 length:1656 start_codon:yes stop_codon:yes gene_type:complete